MNDYIAVINLQQQGLIEAETYRITLIGRLIKELRCGVVVGLIKGVSDARQGTMDGGR